MVHRRGLISGQGVGALVVSIILWLTLLASSLRAKRRMEFRERAFRVLLEAGFYVLVARLRGRAGKGRFSQSRGTPCGLGQGIAN